MNIIYGFGGMRTDAGVLIFKPSIPKAWKSFSFRVLFKGSILSVCVDKENVVFKLVEGPEIPISVFGKDYFVNLNDLSIKLPEDRKA